ncbi:hypothetical protein [Abyssisolibacter fermentans]|nr:hypothetical protein [Abyssisolibacter fermentans]
MKTIKVMCLECGGVNIVEFQKELTPQTKSVEIFCANCGRKIEVRLQ